MELLSTGGTAHLLAEKRSASDRSFSDYTGFPEMMDGRVKTLHPKGPRWHSWSSRSG
ncbi:hypothetical protein [Citrobacter freundii]|uniref:hypothetical protein n=1 Tax=Citrobacter freundii TaxID=546 RepID=UPI00388F4D37